MLPSVFTETPMEAVIVDLGAELGASIGAAMTHELVLGTLVALIVLKLGLGLLHADDGPGALRAGGRALLQLTVVVVVVWALGGTSEVQMAPHGADAEAWSDYGAVTGDEAYASISEPAAAGRGYAYTIGFIEGITSMFSSAMPEPEVHPADAALLLARLGAQQLKNEPEDVDVLQAWEALDLNCKRDAAVVGGASSSIGQLYETETDGCADRMDDFAKAVEKRSEARQAALEGDEATAMTVLEGLYAFDTTEAANYINSIELVNTAQTRYASAVENGTDLLDPSRHEMAAGYGAASSEDNTLYGSGWDDVFVDGIFGNTFGKLGTATGSWITGGNLNRRMAYAESANQFMAFADLIPATRGMVRAGLAMLFPLAAVLAAFGWRRWFVGWCITAFTVSMHIPMSQLLYVFMRQWHAANNYASGVEASAANPLVVSGAMQLPDQILQVQTAYVNAQMGMATALLAIGGIGFLYSNRAANAATEWMGGAAKSIWVAGASLGPRVAMAGATRGATTAVAGGVSRMLRGGGGASSSPPKGRGLTLDVASRRGRA